MKKQFTFETKESTITAIVRTCIAIPSENQNLPREMPEYRRWAYKDALHMRWEISGETGTKVDECIFFGWEMPETEEELRDMLISYDFTTDRSVLDSVEYPRCLVIEQQNWEGTRWGEKYDIFMDSENEKEDLEECRYYQDWFEDVFYPDLYEEETLKHLGRECFLPDDEKWVTFTLYEATCYGSPIYDSPIDDVEYRLSEIAERIYDELDYEDKIIALAGAIQADDEWNFDLLEKLCAFADMTEEWENRTEDTFESIAYKAAEKLGVELIGE